MGAKVAEELHRAREAIRHLIMGGAGAEGGASAGSSVEGTGAAGAELKKDGGEGAAFQGIKRLE